MNLNIALQSQFIPLMEKKEYKELDSLVKNYKNKFDTRITIISPKGKVLADSDKNPDFMENHGSRPEIIEADSAGVGKILRFSTTVREEMYYVAMPVNHEGKLLGYSRLSLYLSHINDLIDELTVRILNITIIVVIAALIALWFFSRSLSQPVKKLAEASRKVADGDFDTKVNLKNRDEIGDLANNFNYMTAEIKSLFEQVNKQKQEWNNLITSIQEGFVVVDEAGKILLYNRGFIDIVGQDSLRDKNYKDVVQEKKLVKIFKKIRKKREKFTKEIELPNRYLLCSATYIESRKEIILVFHDITDIKEIERIKRDIVANVSHELRTPLTAIKGFLETLEEELDEKGRHYAGIIKRHTDRLINIVQDLLSLSELEETGTKLIYSKVDMKDICEHITKIFEPKIAEKKLELTYDIEDDLPPVTLDMFKIEQVLINLIDNSIKYTDEGGIRITIGRIDDNLEIIIRDTGIGIPLDDQKRIFERFYTVDKSRSRKLGGTGLGLSIVKHIIKAHKGIIQMASIPKEGSKFIIRLPMEPEPEN